MKKIYFSAMACILMLCSISLIAQPPATADCMGVPRATNYNIEGDCIVLISGFKADATVILVDNSSNIIANAHTDAQGFAKFNFNCSLTPYKALTVVGSCEAIVPPQATLPVKLSAFDAQLKNDNSVLLKWVSELELTSYKYVVQKSNDGANFSDIGSVAAAGNSISQLKYSFTDNSFISGASFYRLKQIDIDGKVEYSKIAYVNNKGGAGTVTSIVPNPFTSQSNIQLIGINSAELNAKNVQVYNSFGQRINYRITNGSNAIAIDPSAARGIYILKVKEQTFKLVKN